MSKQALIQKYVQVWRAKGVADQLADYEYLIGYREMLFDFIRSKGLVDDWVDFFAHATRPDWEPFLREEDRG